MFNKWVHGIHDNGQLARKKSFPLIGCIHQLRLFLVKKKVRADKISSFTTNGNTSYIVDNFHTIFTLKKSHKFLCGNFFCLIIFLFQLLAKPLYERFFFQFNICRYNQWYNVSLEFMDLCDDVWHLV